MNSARKAALIILGCVLTIAFGIWRYLTVGGARPAHGAVVLDLSESSTNKCTCLSALVEREITASSSNGESTLTVFHTGDETTANEPVLVARYQVPHHRKVIEGRSAAGRRKEDILTDLKTRCEKLAATKRSPIFLAATRATEHLRSLGCGEGSDCRMYVVSDGEELTDRGIAQAIGGRRSKSGVVLPKPIANEGIRVIFCGMAETSGHLKSANGKPQQLTRDRDPMHADRLREVWTSLFTQTQLVMFEPFCSTTKDNSLAQRQ